MLQENMKWTSLETFGGNRIWISLEETPGGNMKWISLENDSGGNMKLDS
jgi:hypothetical protein